MHDLAAGGVSWAEAGAVTASRQRAALSIRGQCELLNFGFTQRPWSPACTLGLAFLSESLLPERLSGGTECPEQGRGRGRV